MDKYLTYGMILDAMLVAAEYFLEFSHTLLPLGGSHFGQLSVLLLSAYLYGEHRRVSKKPPEALPKANEAGSGRP